MIWGGLKPTHHNKMVGVYRALSELAKWMGITPMQTLCA